MHMYIYTYIRMCVCECVSVFVCSVFTNVCFHLYREHIADMKEWNFISILWITRIINALDSNALQVEFFAAFVWYSLAPRFNFVFHHYGLDKFSISSALVLELFLLLRFFLDENIHGQILNGRAWQGLKYLKYHCIS